MSSGTQGDKVRALKEKGISKDELGPHVARLLELKALLPPSSAAKGGSKPKKAAKKVGQCRVCKWKGLVSY